MKKKNLYLLYEIVDREFESKFLLAANASLKKWRSFILERNFFLDNIEKFSPGVVIYKSITKSDLKILEKCKKNNHFFICLDEEGILQWDEEYKYKIRYDQECVNLVDKILLLNTQKEKLIKSHYLVKNNQIKITGFPRFDFLKSIRKNKNLHPVVKEIKDKYQNFIFFPTSFINNPLMGKNGFYRQYEEALGGAISYKQKLFIKGVYKISELNYKKNIQFLKKIAKKFPNINIILRPHISENKKTWKKIFYNYSNIYLDNKHPSYFYTLSSILTFQWGSTISFESFALGKICLQMNNPKITRKIKKYDFIDHYKFIVAFKNFKKGIDYIKQKLKNSSNIKKIEDRILKNLNNQKYIGVQKNSVNNILNVINSFKVKKYANTAKFNIFDFFHKILIHKIIFYLYSKSGIIDLFNDNFFRGKYIVLSRKFKSIHLNNFEYSRRKHKKISDERVRQNLDLFYDYKEHKKGIKISRIYKNNFIIDL
jgi:surface carbohydrate biosynthesis protein